MCGRFIWFIQPARESVTERDKGVFALAEERPEHGCRLDDITNDDRNDNVD
jgi:hypothetical protein